MSGADDGPISGRAAAIIVAAGSGDRLGAGVPKAFVTLAGRPMVAHSLQAVAATRRFARLVLVVPEAWVEEGHRVAEAVAPAMTPIVIPGGSTRHRSVALGMDRVGPEVTIVVCHDAARPMAKPALFDRVIDALRPGGGVVPVVPTADTPKRIQGGLVLETIARGEIGLAQTPQAFDVTALREAHRRAADGMVGTDDASLLEAAGFQVVTVPGDPLNFKVTTPEDLRRAEWLLGERAGEETPA